MSDLSPLKQMIQTEAVTSGAAASEETIQMIAGGVNFWNSFYEGSRGWFLNGPYNVINGAQSGVDGTFFCFSDMEVYAVGVANLEAGTSGSIEFDIIRHPASGGPSASIFTVRPIIPASAGNNAWLVKRFSDNTILFQSAGVTLPVLATSNLTAGDMLTCSILQKQPGGKSASIILGIKPRN